MIIATANSAATAGRTLIMGTRAVPFVLSYLGSDDQGALEVQRQSGGGASA